MSCAEVVGEELLCVCVVCVCVYTASKYTNYVCMCTASKYKNSTYMDEITSQKGCVQRETERERDRESLLRLFAGIP